MRQHNEWVEDYIERCKAKMAKRKTEPEPELAPAPVILEGVARRRRKSS